MTFLYYIFLGFSPAIFCLWFIYNKDKWEPEPKKQVIKIFFIGIVSILPAAILENILQKKVFQISITDMSYSLSLNLIACFLVIGPIEEFFKYSVVKVFIYPRKDFNEKVDGVVYMVAAAMGFSGLENLMYILRTSMIDPTQVASLAIMRGIFSTPAHAIFSGFLGVYLGEAKFASSKLKAFGYILKGFFIAIFLHGLYDAIAFGAKNYAIFCIIPLLLISGWILLKKIKKLVNESPFRK